MTGVNALGTNRSHARAPRARAERPPAANLGDVAVSMQVTYPAGVLESWLVPRDEAAVRADAMRLSRSVQASLKRLLARTHFENIDNLQFHENVAALLVWSSMPVSTSIADDGRRVQFNTDRDFFWDYAARDLRVSVAQDSHTAAALAKALGDAEARLRAAGRSNADLFRPARAGQFVELALNSTGDQYLSSLLNAEALIVAGATNALRKIAATVAATTHGSRDRGADAVGVCGNARGHVQRAPAVSLYARGDSDARPDHSGRRVGGDPRRERFRSSERDAQHLRARRTTSLR